MVAAAIAMPASAGAVTLVATAPNAGAAATINCHVAGTVTFASPGLTHNGKGATTTTSTTKVSGETYAKGTTTCSGTGPALAIKSANTKCNTKGATTTVPACGGHPTEYGYDSFDSYAASGVSSVKADVKTVKFTINRWRTRRRRARVRKCRLLIVPDVEGLRCRGRVRDSRVRSPLRPRRRTRMLRRRSSSASDRCRGAHLQVSKSPKATKPGFVFNLETGLGTSAPDKLINVTKALIDPLESSLNIA